MSEPQPRVLDRHATRQTVLWGVGLTFATKVASILLGLFLARLITPQVFGAYGVVSSVIVLVLSFSMSAFSEHLYFHRDPAPEDYHRHLAFGVLLHLALFVITNAVALAMLFSPVYRPVALYVGIGSLAMLLNVPRIYYAIYLRAELQWKKQRILHLTSFGLYAVVSITLALTHHGLLALLAQNLLVPVPYVVALLLDDRKLRGLRFDWGAYRAAFNFGLLRTGSTVLANGQTLLESIALSALTGFGPLGLVIRAKGVAQLATSWLSDQVTAVLYPSLARLEPRSDAARRAAGLLIKIGLWTTAPVAVGMAVAQQATVYALYGYQWGQVVPLLRPMLLAAVAGSLFTVAKTVILTNDGPRRALYLDVLVTFANIACLIGLALGGMQAYANWLGALNMIALLAVLVLMVRARLLNLGDLVTASIPGLILTGLGLAATAGGRFARVELINPFATVAVTGVACTLGMLLLVRLIDPRGLNTLCGLIPGGRFARGWLLLRGPAYVL